MRVSGTSIIGLKCLPYKWIYLVAFTKLPSGDRKYYECARLFICLLIVRPLMCLFIRPTALINIDSKTVPCFSPMYKEGNELFIIYPLIYGSVLQVRAYCFYSPRNQTTSCQYKLSKKNQCNALQRHNRSCRLRMEIKHRYSCFIAE